MTRERLVVVGNGMAGARLVEELLDRGYGGHVTVLGDEEAPAVQPDPAERGAGGHPPAGRDRPGRPRVATTPTGSSSGSAAGSSTSTATVAR